jgi:hypothetical protein
MLEFNSLTSAKHLKSLPIYLFAVATLLFALAMPAHAGTWVYTGPTVDTFEQSNPWTILGGDSSGASAVYYNGGLGSHSFDETYTFTFAWSPASDTDYAPSSVNVEIESYAECDYCLSPSTQLFEATVTNGLSGGTLLADSGIKTYPPPYAEINGFPKDSYTSDVVDSELTTTLGTSYATGVTGTNYLSATFSYSVEPVVTMTGGANLGSSADYSEAQAEVYFYIL